MVCLGEGGGRVSARRPRYLFFASPKKSTQKKGDPQSATPTRCVGANLQRCGCGVRRGTRFALRAPLGQPRRVSSRGMGASTPMLTPQPPRRRRSQQGWDSRTSNQPNSRTSIRAIAALGLACAARGACAREFGPSAAMARVDVLFPVPLWMRRGAQGLADQGSRLSERSESERVRARPRQTRAPQVAPTRSGGDADSGVALSLVPFFRRRERKGLACRATPGLRPQPRHAVTPAHY